MKGTHILANQALPVVEDPPRSDADGHHPPAHLDWVVVEGVPRQHRHSWKSWRKKRFTLQNVRSEWKSDVNKRFRRMYDICSWRQLLQMLNTTHENPNLNPGEPEPFIALKLFVVQRYHRNHRSRTRTLVGEIFCLRVQHVIYCAPSALLLHVYSLYVCDMLFLLGGRGGK